MHGALTERFYSLETINANDAARMPNVKMGRMTLKTSVMSSRKLSSTKTASPGASTAAAGMRIRRPSGWGITSGCTVTTVEACAARTASAALFQRAANDPGAGWLLGLAYGFLLWIAAPIVVLPLIRGPAMAAGSAATGFLVTFLLWGLLVGILFPRIHRPLHAKLDSRRHKSLGPDAAKLGQRLLRRPT